ncbi:hypothetical protein AVEN_47531-1 [Araneus ventricosus]|uniref:Uncharacterized protein n=1 Tax=Araneus ventricosus TaxID=182803 RepID=A0A4Y2Q0V6_ARAVE|nr:hypothetical protein AVEN_47531-1 [Araneus ventricosus]
MTRPAKWLRYRPIDTPGTKMYHPSKGSPRTTNTWGYIAVHEKLEASKAVTASHGELLAYTRGKEGESKNSRGGKTRKETRH